MTRQEIIEKLQDVLKMAVPQNASQFENIDENLELVSDLGLNSVGILYVVIAIEEFFNIHFDDVGFNDFKTLKDVVDYIQAKID